MTTEKVVVNNYRDALGTQVTDYVIIPKFGIEGRLTGRGQSTTNRVSTDNIKFIFIKGKKVIDVIIYGNDKFERMERET